MATRPHKLELYECAVQHPQAEAAFLERVYRHYFGGRAGPSSAPVGFRGRLREDFAGSAALAAAWVERGEDYRSLAVERHGPTARWARRRIDATMQDRAQDVVLVESDVMDMLGPRVDIVCALNFSALTYHDRDALRRYLCHARRCLDKQGVIVLDLFGGPGAQASGTQSVRHDGFTYHWEQRAFDRVTRRIDCRMHFTLDDGTAIRDAFRYDWRLWPPQEVLALMSEVGLEGELWCDGWNPRTKRSDGAYRPIAPAGITLDKRHDWIAYAVGVRRCPNP